MCQAPLGYDPGVFYLGLFVQDMIDIAVVVSGDSDLRPLAEVVNAVWQGDKKVIFVFPFDRFSVSLKNICPESFKLSVNSYRRNQLPHNCKLSTGKLIKNPFL